MQFIYLHVSIEHMQHLINWYNVISSQEFKYGLLGTQNIMTSLDN